MATRYLVRTSGDPSSLLPNLRRSIAAVSPQLVVTSLTTMESRVAESVSEERFRATLSSLFGSAALVLAAAGLYGSLPARRASRADPMVALKA